jgi:hypothetical protein
MDHASKPIPASLSTKSVKKQGGHGTGFPLNVKKTCLDIKPDFSKLKQIL